MIERNQTCKRLKDILSSSDCFGRNKLCIIVQREPLEALVAEVKKTLEASKVVSNYKGQLRISIGRKIVFSQR